MHASPLYRHAPTQFVKSLLGVRVFLITPFIDERASILFVILSLSCQHAKNAVFSALYVSYLSKTQVPNPRLPISKEYILLFHPVSNWG